MKRDPSMKRPRLGLGVGLVSAAAVASLAALLAASACDGTGGGSPGATTSYYHDVKPIIDGKCIQCHYDGGIAPFALTTYEDVRKEAAAIKVAVQSRIMPPWPPDDACNSYQADRSLDQAQIDLVSKWVDEEAPEGDPKREGPPLADGNPGLSRVDRSLSMPDTYTPQSNPDDYHCFVLDWPDTDVEYVTGFRVTPGEARVVHHAIAFVASPSDLPTVQALDDAQPGPGYTCFGSAGFNSAGWLGTWAPGTAGSDYPAGTGIKIEPGSKIILQVHYNTLTAGALPDRTSLELKVDETVAKEAHIQPWANPQWLQKGGMPIPAATKGVHFEFSADPTKFFSGNKPMTIYSAGLHMHTLGHTARLGVEHPAGDETCLLDIPSWNFHWQGGYELAQPLTFQPGDQMSLECDFDNATMNEVEWGEGTTDEMCLGIFYYTVE
jgi:hypothetical protein